MTALPEVLGEALAFFGAIGLAWVVANVIQAWRHRRAAPRRSGAVLKFVRSERKSS